jgi:hypothetical protein
MEPGPPYFQGGPQKDVRRMIQVTARLRDEGGLPAEASLIFSQLLLNLGGHVGREKAEQLVAEFLDAADVPLLE